MSNKIYTDSEPTIYFLPPSAASGSNVTAFDPSNLPNGSGWASDVRDLGVSPRSTLYRWRGKFAAAGPTVDTGVDFFWSSFDVPSETGSAITYNFGTDLGLPSGQGVITNLPGAVQNLQWIGSVMAETGGSGTIFTSSGMVQLFGRYGQLVVYNNSGAAITAASGVNGFSLTPEPDEIQ